MRHSLKFHTGVSWLSRGKVIKCAFVLGDELKTLFNKKSKSQFEALFWRHKPTSQNCLLG